MTDFYFSPTPGSVISIVVGGPIGVAGCSRLIVGSGRLLVVAPSMETVSRGRLNTLLSLGLVAVVFAWSAWSWVQFFASPDGGAGSPTGLFTQTDYPAVTLASRIVASGNGAQLYDLDLQLEGQRQLIRERYLHQPST